jgi:glyoxylase-like metal-dependent hydrolase (beta-lactamase superfamily II)
VNLAVHPFFDVDTFSWSYVLANPATGCCAIIDPVLNYDPQSGTVHTQGADHILELVDANGYCVEWILETHVHADHLSAARYLKQQLICAQIAIGEHVRDVQAHFVPELELDTAIDGSQFDRLLGDGERVSLGHACGRVMHTPGHTAACVSYVFDGFAFVGDTVFMPDYGTARCDFPGGDALTLYRSVQKLYALPGETRMLVCHDYGNLNDRHGVCSPEIAATATSLGERSYRFFTTVAEQRRCNRMLRPVTPVAEFVAAREARDRTLAPPRLMEAALRANLAGGASAVGAISRSRTLHRIRDREIALHMR